MTETTPHASEHDPTEASSEAPSGPSGQQRLRIGAVIAVAVALGFIVWAIVGSGSDGGEEPAAATGPVAVTYTGLTTLAGAIGEPIYWVGPRGGMRYELQQLSDGKVYLRYLPQGVEAGDAGQYLTVATYPLEDAYTVTSGHAVAEGSEQLDVGEGAAAFTSTSNPNSAYVAFQGSDVQVEVYDPQPGVARRLVLRGAVTAVPASVVTEAKAVTPKELAEVSESLGQPIYWAGPEPPMTYEVSQNAEGSIFVRYLREGVGVGDPGKHRTIATYPLADAFAQTKALQSEPGVELIELDGGAIAIFDEAPGTDNGYVVYPGVDYQIEVFDPEPGAARRLVEAGRIAPVG